MTVSSLKNLMVQHIAKAPRKINWIAAKSLTFRTFDYGRVCLMTIDLYCEPTMWLLMIVFQRLHSGTTFHVTE